MKSNLAADLTAGIGSGLAFIPLILAIASIAFGSLGAETAAAMSVAVLATNLIAGGLLAVIARCPMVVAVSGGSSALVMAGLFGGLIARGEVPTIPDVMAITLSVAAVAGLVQLALVKAGAAALGPLAPYPVIAGLVNGTSVLILMSQLPSLRAHPTELIVAAVTAATMLKFPVRFKVPPVLPAILAGMAAHAALSLLHVPVGPVLSAMPSPFAYPHMVVDALGAWVDHPGMLPWRAILTAGVTIALLGVLETLATLSALSDLGMTTDERRDLRAVGLANLLVAATAGGPPVSAPVASGVSLWRMGGRDRLAPVTRVLTIGLGAAFLGGYLPLIPQGTLVGLVIAIGLRLFDQEPARLLWRAMREAGPHRMEIGGSAAISFVVVIVAVMAGLAVAVAVGAMACLLVFTAAMAGSAVRRVYDGAATLSRVRRGTEETAVLLRERQAIAVLELAGPLFFGNISPLGHALDDARSSGARHVVIDVSRIVRVDMSGARRLMSTVRQRRDHGMQVVLAPIRPGHPVSDYLTALGMTPGECFAEITDALAAAEAAVLEEAGVTASAFMTAEATLQALGMPAEHAATLAERAEIRDTAAGDVLCRAGDPADSIFVLMQGRADVRLPGASDDASTQVLLAHLRAGAVVGERALFEAGTRSADVVCTEACRVLILSGAVLATILREASAASLALVVAITRNTSVSLQQANAAIQRLQA